MDILTFAEILFTCMIFWNAVKIKQNLDTWQIYWGGAAVWFIAGVSGFIKACGSYRRRAGETLYSSAQPFKSVFTVLYHNIM